jgi:hypothetical protein
MSLWGWLFVAAFSLGVGASPGCRRSPLHDDGGVGMIAGTGGVGGAGGGGGGITGTGGVPAACAGPSDARLVVASQRILRLTMNETLNTVLHLFGTTEAAALVSAGLIGTADDSTDLGRRFPPLAALPETNITGTSFPQLEAIAEHVASYVLANFATVTACPGATDACATAYLDRLAAKAYRRPLTSDEQSRFAALYAKLRAPQTVQGYEVTFTIEEATSYAVRALLGSPQMLWRWELGDPAMASAPAGIPLTEDELATQLAFFLTDQPPDANVLAAARAGTLRANLAGHVDALLATVAARDWLGRIIATYLRLNTLPELPIDPVKFPFYSSALAADLGTESRLFLDDALWSGNLTDLLLSRRAFLNTNLATMIYMVAAPPGATPTTFVQTTLPADKRAGVLTNAALLTSRPRVQADNLVVPRGLLVSTVLLCMPHPGPDMPGSAGFDRQTTARQQVELRAAQPACSACHAQFDPYGLALENYDDFGRYRTVDEAGRPVDARTTLPAAVGGGAVANGVELAQKLAASPAFTNCMANVLLRYALVDPATSVEVPLASQQAGCATADVVQRYQSGSGQTFTDLVRATATAPAFGLRRAAP